MNFVGLALGAFLIVMAGAFIEVWARQNSSLVLGAVVVVLVSIGLYFLYYLPKIRKRKIISLKDAMESVSGELRGEKISGGAFYFKRSFDKLKWELEFDLIYSLVSREVKKHIKVLMRKKKQLTYKDDYGVVNNRGWEKECLHFIKNVVFPLDCSSVEKTGIQSSDLIARLSDMSNKENIKLWIGVVDDVVQLEMGCEPDEGYEVGQYLNGHEYEELVASLVISHGWDAKVTKGSGDHGADVIAEKSGVKIAIQCKYYSAPVGNKSVQEAYSAKAFYDCDFACVVTNSSFTPAARKAANKMGVKLLHHEELGHYLVAVERHE